MKTVRYTSDVHSPAFLAGKKDQRRELEDAHANTLIRAGYCVEVRRPFAEPAAEVATPEDTEEDTADLPPA